MGKYLDSSGLSHLIGKIKTALGLKQDTLVSGTTIKTINNQSLLGSGNIAISGGSSLPSGGAANDVLAKNSSTEGDLKWLTLGSVAMLDALDFGSLAWEDSLTYSDVGAAAATHNHAASQITQGTLALARGGTASDNTSRAINTVFAGPSSGSAGDASWRKLVAADIPSLAISKITNLQNELNGKQAAGDYWAGSKGDTSYWGLVNPDGSSSGWVRTPASGLLPAASGGGSSSLGTSTWPFTNLYATNIYHNGTKLGTAATHADTDYADATHSHSEYFSDQVNRTANTVLAAPNGSAGHASFRKLVVADIPYTTLYGYYAASSATQVNVANTSLYRFLVILFRTNSATYAGGGASATTSPLNSTVVHINKKSSGSVYVSLMGAHALSASSVQIRTGLATVTCSATAGKVTLSNQRYINLGNGSSGTQEVGTQTDMALVGVIGIY